MDQPSGPAIGYPDRWHTIKCPAGTGSTDGTCFNNTALVTGISNGSQRGSLILGLPTTLVHGLKCQPTDSSAFVNPPPVISLTSSPEFVSGELLP